MLYTTIIQCYICNIIYNTMLYNTIIYKLFLIQCNPVIKWHVNMLLFRGWPTPLENIIFSWDFDIPNWMEK